MPISLDDIFNDDDFGLLDPKQTNAAQKTDEDRLIDSFEEINVFWEKNGREPSSGSMSEYNLQARLKAFRSDQAKKQILKPFDRFNLLGHVEMVPLSMDEVLDDDDSGLLSTEADNSIFHFKHTPKPKGARAETDFIAQRKPISEKEFAPYEQMFQQIHRELKEGKRRLQKFERYEDNLQAGNFYLLEGVLLYLESADIKKITIKSNQTNRLRLDGRTRIIFENGTQSNMRFRSLGKRLQENGRLITATDYAVDSVMNPQVAEEDVQSGWLYVLKSKSTEPQIASLENLYKIGFSTASVEDRIKNALKEATYLFADVEVVASYRCFNTNTKHLENLLHRFFASACLNVDIYDEFGSRVTPREWFCAPLHEIDKAIALMQSGRIVNCRYSNSENRIVEK